MRILRRLVLLSMATLGSLTIGSLTIGSLTIGSVASAQSPRAIALGTDFGCGIEADGHVRCWGSSRDGQCGVVEQSSMSARRIEGLEGVEEIAAGYSFACARKAGEVWCWGDNGRGQLGVAEPSERTTPERVPGLSDVAELGLGNFNGCARKENGEVWCWGLGQYGQLGPSVQESQAAPIKIAGLPPATRLFAGDHHFCAMDGRQRLHCWGKNEYGQAGSPRRQRRAPPRRIRNTGEIAQVALGGSHSCIRNTDGRVRCWGLNLFTIGDAGNLRAPTIDPRLRDVSDMALSTENQCFVSGGQVLCSGVNRQGELHVPTPEMGGVVLLPTAVPGLSDATGIRMGARAHCALRQSGQWVCWGWNRTSENSIGVGSRASHVETPTPLQWPVR